MKKAGRWLIIVAILGAIVALIIFVRGWMAWRKQQKAAASKARAAGNDGAELKTGVLSYLRAKKTANPEDAGDLARLQEDGSMTEREAKDVLVNWSAWQKRNKEAGLPPPLTPWDYAALYGWETVPDKYGSG